MSRVVVVIESEHARFAVIGSEAGIELAKRHGAPILASEIKLLSEANRRYPLPTGTVQAIAAVKNVWPDSRITWARKVMS